MWTLVWPCCSLEPSVQNLLIQWSRILYLATFEEWSIFHSGDSISRAGSPNPGPSCECLIVLAWVWCHSSRNCGGSTQAHKLGWPTRLLDHLSVFGRKLMDMAMQMGLMNSGSGAPQEHTPKIWCMKNSIFHNLILIAPMITDIGKMLPSIRSCLSSSHHLWCLQIWPNQSLYKTSFHGKLLTFE